MRRLSRNEEPIPVADHRQWLEEILADPDRQLLIAESGGFPIGQVRFDLRSGSLHEISVSLARERRGTGLGFAMVAAGVERLWAETGPDRADEVEAWVKQGNQSSLRAFARAGFERTGETSEGGLVRLVAARPD